MTITLPTHVIRNQHDRPNYSDNSVEEAYFAEHEVLACKIEAGKQLIARLCFALGAFKTAFVAYQPHLQQRHDSSRS